MLWLRRWRRSLRAECTYAARYKRPTALYTYPFRQQLDWSGTRQHGGSEAWGEAGPCLGDDGIVLRMGSFPRKPWLNTDRQILLTASVSLFPV